MMPDRPDAGELLALAEKVLRERLIALLPDEHRADALLVADAISIAAREHRDGDRLREETRRRLRELYPDTDTDENAVRRCAAEIRAGRFDSGNAAARLHRLLLDLAVQRLAISNPQYLAETWPDPAARAEPTSR